MLKKLLFKLTGRSTEDTDEASGEEPTSSETGVRHVMSSEDGWVILKERGGSSTLTFDTKREAVDEARSVCKDKGLKLAIYKQDGSKQREHDYS